MLRERIPPWGSSRGLETPLARGSADPRPPERPRPRGPKAPRGVPGGRGGRGGSAPLGTGRWGAVSGHVVPTREPLSPPPVPYRTFGQPPLRGGKAALAPSGGHLLTCYSPVCHGMNHTRAFGSPHPPSGTSAPGALGAPEGPHPPGPRDAPRSDAVSPPSAPERNDGRGTAFERGAPRAREGGRRPGPREPLEPRGRRPGRGVGTPAAPKDAGSPHAGPRRRPRDMPRQGEPGPVLTKFTPIRLACIRSFTSLYAAQRLNASVRLGSSGAPRPKAQGPLGRGPHGAPGWQWGDSNPQPQDYESCALTG